jgi:signal transduction histidine kinase
MKKIVAFIRLNGFNSNYSLELVRNIKLTNIFIAIFSLLVIPFAILFYRSLAATLTCLSTIVIHSISFALIRFHKHKAGRFLFSITPALATYIIGILLYNENLSDGMGAKIIILGTIIIPFVVFSAKERVLTILLLIVLLSLILSFNYVDSIIDIQVIDINFDTKSFRILAILTAFFMIAFNFFLYQDELARRNAQLEEQNEIISQQINELRKLNEDKDRFIAILAHDLRSPFNTILGFLDLLKENINEYDIDKITIFVNMINNSAKNTFLLLEDILMWVRANLGKMPFEPQKIKLASICQVIIEDLQFNANIKSIKINSFINNDVLVFADENMIKTILRNLVSNSIKYTNKNGVIEIYAETNQTNIIITVSDNGVGIEPDNLSSLFDISHKRKTEGTEKEVGTGLGLIFCKEFVEKHGGKIWVISEVGKGSDFKFTLPN